MASTENLRQPLIDPLTSGGPSNVKYTESLPLTAINMTPNPTSSKKKEGSDSKPSLRQRLYRQRSSIKEIFKINLSRRLALRKELQNRL